MLVNSLLCLEPVSNHPRHFSNHIALAWNCGRTGQAFSQMYKSNFQFCSWRFWERKCTVSLFVFRFLCSWMSPCIIVRRHHPLGQWFLVRIRQVDLEQESAGDSGCLCVCSVSCPKISLTTRCMKHKQVWKVSLNFMTRSSQICQAVSVWF